MKSVFLSFLIFAGVFLLAGSGVLSVIGKDWFHYTSYVIFAVVMIAGVCITFMKKPATKAEDTNNKDTPITQEENENDRK